MSTRQETKIPEAANKLAGYLNNKRGTLYGIIAVLATLLGATVIALFSYSTVGYKKAIANDVRIAVVETRQEAMMNKLNEISKDIKIMLKK